MVAQRSGHDFVAVKGEFPLLHPLVLLGCLHRPRESDWAPPRVVVVAVASSKHDVQWWSV